MECIKHTESELIHNSLDIFPEKKKMKPKTKNENDQIKQIVYDIFSHVDPNFDFKWIVENRSQEQILELCRQLKKEVSNFCVLTGKAKGGLVSTQMESDFEWIQKFKESPFFLSHVSVSENLKTASLILAHFSEYPENLPDSIRKDFSAMSSREIQRMAYRFNKDLKRDSKGRMQTGIGQIVGELSPKLIDSIQKKNLCELKNDTGSGYPLTTTENFLASLQLKCDKKKLIEVKKMKVEE